MPDRQDPQVLLEGTTCRLNRMATVGITPTDLAYQRLVAQANDLNFQLEDWKRIVIRHPTC